MYQSNKDADSVTVVCNVTTNTYHSTLQGAINRASPGDYLEIRSGTDMSIVHENVYIDKDIAISSESIYKPVIFKQTDPPSDEIFLIEGDCNVTLDNIHFDSVNAAIVIQDSLAGEKTFNNIHVIDSEHFLLTDNCNNIECYKCSVINPTTKKYNSWKMMFASTSNVILKNIYIDCHNNKFGGNNIFISGSSTISSVEINNSNIGLWLSGGSAMINDLQINKSKNAKDSSILVTGCADIININI